MLGRPTITLMATHYMLGNYLYSSQKVHKKILLHSYIFTYTTYRYAYINHIYTHDYTLFNKIKIQFIPNQISYFANSFILHTYLQSYYYFYFEFSTSSEIKNRITCIKCNYYTLDSGYSDFLCYNALKEWLDLMYSNGYVRLQM